MNITETKIPIREIVKGYEDKKEEGVLAFGGFLQARPKYQREFVYDKQKQKAVIETIMKGFPISIMYWVKNGENDYETMDYISIGFNISYGKHKSDIWQYR